jgi:hypothetical protein
MRLSLAVSLSLLAVCTPTRAHHSFPVHFVPEGRVIIEGEVTEFRFRNPHGLILLRASVGDGPVADWRVETNSPSILRRRGWSAESIKPGDRVKIEGYPARDDSNFMRVYRLEFEDGREMIGQRPSVAADED